MNDLIEVKHWGKDSSYCENPQTVASKISYISSKKNGLAMCTDFVKCRDFLHDMVAACLKEKSVTIYSMTYNPKKNPALDMRRTRMFLRPPTKKHTDDDIAAIKYATRECVKIEEQLFKMGFTNNKTRSKFALAKTSKGTLGFLTEGPAVWMANPPLVSLHSYIIMRLGYYIDLTIKKDKKLAEKIEKADFIEVCELVKSQISGGDRKILDSVIKGWPVIFPKFNEIFRGKMSDAMFHVESVDTLHNSSGIKSFCDGKTGVKEINKIILKEIGKETS